MSKQDLEAKNERFELAIETAGGYEKAAKLAQRSVAQLKRYAKKGDDVPLSVLYAIAQEAEMSIDWIVTGIGDPYRDDGSEFLNNEIMGEYLRHRLGGLSEKEKRGSKDPYLPDPEFVRIMTARSFSRDTIALAVAELVAYIRDKNLDIDPKKTGDLAAQLCEMARDENGVDAASVERLLKFKNLL